MNVVAAIRSLAIGGVAAVLLASCGGDDSVPGGDASAAGGSSDAAAIACEEAPPHPTLPSLRLTADGPLLRDALGREVTLRGVNAGGRAKFAPFFAFPFAESGVAGQEGALPFDEAVVAYTDKVAEWGHNVVRLTFSWEALEPTRGAYDDTYLSRYEALALAFIERGVRVIVDFHQDVFAAPFCGDGFPLWAVHDGATPVDPAQCPRWFAGYFNNDDVKRAFDRFWSNEDGLMDAFDAMWRHRAARMGPHDGVIGFEVINEPYEGSMEGEAWKAEVLSPFYARLAGVIRGEAPDALVFFDSTGLDAVAAATSLPKPDAPQLVFAPHFYTSALYGGGDPRVLIDQVGSGLAKWAAHRDDWQIPMLVGEFGVRAVSEGSVDYLAAHYDAFDAHGLHATVWEYSATEDDWNAEGLSLASVGYVERATVDAVVRPYPAAVAGAITAFTWDRAASSGALEIEATAGGTSEIAAPERLFGGGATLTVEPAATGCATHDVAAGVIRLRAERDGPLRLAFTATAP